MHYPILFAVQATRVILVLYWFSLIRASVHAGSLHMPAPESGVLLGYSLLAAGLIWLPRLRSWKHALAAFVVLTTGALRIVLAGSDFRPHGLAILTAAFFGMWHLYHQRSRDASNRSAESGTPRVTPPAPQPSVAKASVADAPSQPPTQQQAAAPAYDFNENIRHPRYTFADVVGMAETKKRLAAAAQEILKGQGKPRNGMILFGDPGNGKSMFAEALAGELQLPFFSFAYGDMASKWVNETPQKVKAAFQAARRLGTGVFFIDEIDSFLKARDGNAHHMDQDLTNVLLTELVALRDTKIILIGATNMLDKLDGAGIREGRFDFKIEIPAPDLQARQAILRRAIGDELGFDMVDSEAIAKLAERWEGFSASRLSSLGPQLYEMWRDGQFSGKVTFDMGMRAMRLLQGRRGKLPENIKSINEILMPQGSRNALRDLAFKMENVDSLERIGGRLPPGVIFIGPPGTGKTQAAMALAKTSGWAFLKITGAEIIAKPQAWDALYREACDIRPVLVFLDEADGILCDRQYSNYGMVTEKILTTMDGAGGRVRDVLFVAATNHYDRIDSAAVRGGRFEDKIVFDVPGARDMAEYVETAVVRWSDTWQIPQEVRMLLIDKVTGRSIADADAVIQKTIDIAAVRRMRDGSTALRPDDVEQGARSVLVG
ncbi:AAA family ATPase [Ralstonia insidiosa]|nr:AAA family ATPase [Ralstonia insidiosa]